MHENGRSSSFSFFSFDLFTHYNRLLIKSNNDYSINSMKGLSSKREDVTCDRLDKWHLKVLQPKNGYRFSIDALLLADFVKLKKKDALLELGTGCGVVSLILARRFPEIDITAIEIQPDLAAIAQRNVSLNCLSQQIDILEGDINNIQGLIKAGTFGHVAVNPPYRSPSSGRICLESQEALARHEILVNLEKILDAARYGLRPGGRISLIYPADRLAHLISSMRSARLEPKRLQLIHPGPNSQARLALVEGCKDAGEELSILPPLFLN